MRSSAPTVLILGGAFGDVPIISAARVAGYRVISTGNRPSDPGHQFADDYLPSDYSNVDSVLNVARRIDPIGILSSCHDIAAITAARVASVLGLPGHDRPEIASMIHNKRLLRAELRRLNVPTPLACTALRHSDICCSQVPYPRMVKPADLTGGRGIVMAETPFEFQNLMESAWRASQMGEVVVEAYIQGTNHGVSTFIEGGRVSFSFEDDEYYFLNRFRVAGAHSATTLTPENRERVKGFIELMAHQWDLVDGVMHLQVIQSESGIHILEACRRTPGDFYPELVRHARRIDYASSLVNAQLGKPFFAEGEASDRVVIRHVAMPPTSGSFAGISIDPRIRGFVTDIFSWRRVGEDITDPLTWTAGVVVLELERVSARQIIDNIQNLIHVQVRS